MILDTLKRHAAYHALNPRLAKAFTYLWNTDLKALPEGKHAIDGDDIFINVMSGDLKQPQDAPLEAHDKYIDIQVLITGEEERYGWRARAACTSPRGEMSVEKDALFFDDRPDTSFTLRTGEFVIFFPDDVHAPMMGSGHVKKCIVKVLA